MNLVRTTLLTQIGLLMLLVPVVPAHGVEPKRGNYVPADLNLKTHPFVEDHRYGGTYHRATLLGSHNGSWRLRLRYDTGSVTRTLPTENLFLDEARQQPGQSVLVKRTSLGPGNSTLLVTDVNRIGRYGLLFVVSLLVCCLVGGWITARSLLGVIAGMGFLLFYALPAVVDGGSTLLYIGLFYVITTVLILPASLGVNRKGLSAVLAALTTGGLAFGLLYLLAHAMRLVGLRNNSLQILEYAIRYFPELTEPFSILNVLLGGILVGALGVILDVCVDVTSSTAEIVRSRPDLGLAEQMNRTLTVTSRLIGTMTNTLLLAYIGTDMFLILTVYLLPAPNWVLLNKDFVALEVLRGFGGALGFLGAAPLSILFYRWVGPVQASDRPDPPDP